MVRGWPLEDGILKFLLRATWKRFNEWCWGSVKVGDCYVYSISWEYQQLGILSRKTVRLKQMLAFPWNQNWLPNLQDIMQKEDMESLVQKSSKKPLLFFSLVSCHGIFFFFLIDYLMSRCSLWLQDTCGTHKPSGPNPYLGYRKHALQPWPSPSLFQDPPGVKGGSVARHGLEKRQVGTYPMELRKVHDGTEAPSPWYICSVVSLDKFQDTSAKVKLLIISRRWVKNNKPHIRGWLLSV